MPKTNYFLGLDTCFDTLSVSVFSQQTEMCKLTCNTRHKQADLLTEYVGQALKNCNIKACNLDGVFVSSGPGSFTGIKIGLAFARGLCFRSEEKILPVELNFAALFCGQIPLGVQTIHTILPSLVGHIYHQTFNASLQPLTSPCFINKSLFKPKEGDILIDCSQSSPMPSSTQVVQAAIHLKNNPSHPMYHFNLSTPNYLRPALQP